MKYFSVCIYHICYSTHSLRDFLVVCTFLVSVNNDMNIDVQIAVQISAFSYVLFMPRSGIAKSNGNLCAMFCITSITFANVYTILGSHQ